jgi:hypothetical protein
VERGLFGFQSMASSISFVMCLMRSSSSSQDMSLDKTSTDSSLWPCAYSHLEERIQLSGKKCVYGTGESYLGDSGRNIMVARVMTAKTIWNAIGNLQTIYKKVRMRREEH